jgi:hypothetical protein
MSEYCYVVVVYSPEGKSQGCHGIFTTQALAIKAILDWNSGVEGFACIEHMRMNAASRGGTILPYGKQPTLWFENIWDPIHEQGNYQAVDCPDWAKSSVGCL